MGTHEHRFSLTEVRDLGRMISEDFPDARSLSGFRETVGRRQRPQSISTAGLE